MEQERRELQELARQRAELAEHEHAAALERERQQHGAALGAAQVRADTF